MKIVAGQKSIGKKCHAVVTCSFGYYWRQNNGLGVPLICPTHLLSSF